MPDSVDPSLEGAQAHVRVARGARETGRADRAAWGGRLGPGARRGHPREHLDIGAKQLLAATGGWDAPTDGVVMSRSQASFPYQVQPSRAAAILNTDVCSPCPRCALRRRPPLL